MRPPRTSGEAVSLLALMSVALLLGSAAAGAVQPWVLWRARTGVDAEDVPFAHAAVPDATYDRAEECFAGLRTRARDFMERATLRVDVKRVTRSQQARGQETVSVEREHGGSLHTTYMCVPHPVKPE